MKKPYKIGQFRSSQNKSYMTKLTTTTSDLYVYSNEGNNKQFKDKMITLVDNANFSIQQSYHLTCQIQKLATTAKIQNKESDSGDTVVKIYLANSKMDEGSIKYIQLLKTVVLHGNESKPIELIFTPLQAYNRIVFEIQRQQIDYNIMLGGGFIGREIQVGLVQLNELINILPRMKNNIQQIEKMAIQGPSGLLMAINGEEIRVGKTGIYSMIYDIPINKLSFAIADEDLTQLSFIMDFQYYG